MIVKEIFYAIKCDRCGHIGEGHDGYQFFVDESTAEECANEDDWITEKACHYCPDCWSRHDETDEISIKESYPVLVKKIEAFIEKIMSKNCSVVELNTHFELSFWASKLEDAETNWLLSFPVGIDFRENKYSNKQCVITIKKNI